MCCMWRKTEAAFSPFPPRWTTPAIEWSGRSPFRGASTQRGELRKLNRKVEKREVIPMRMWSLRGRAVEGALRLLGLGGALVLLALAAGNSGGVGLAQAQNFEGFEAGSLGPAWQTDGDAPWFVQSTTAHSGSFAAQAGGIGDNESSWLVISGNVPADGAISFWYRVSSESGYDFLRFYIDGQKIDEWSGETGWQQAMFPITAGPHTLAWEYTKDGSGSSGSDTAWLDDIFFPFAVGGSQACTITVSPGQSIQEAIDEAKEGDVICLSEGTWTENLVIGKSVTLRGAGPVKTVIKSAQEGRPVVWIEGSEIEVILEGLTITGARGDCGLVAKGSAQVTLQDSQVSDNEGRGLYVQDSAQVTVQNTTISGNGHGGFLTWIGLYVKDSAQVTVQNTTISGSTSYGIKVTSGQVTLRDVTVSGSDYHGLYVAGSARVMIEDSLIEGNGTDWRGCKEGDKICSGIFVKDEAYVELTNTTIRNNRHWGIAAFLRKCGAYWGNYFRGTVLWQGRGNENYGNGRGDVSLPGLCIPEGACD
ncbi:MAG TPA: hypothetical protein ENF46_01435 [Candidatus Acetothermia bacterium]|nr:hypothetical protein [Candidatus Acetothermia bacterium]